MKKAIIVGLIGLFLISASFGVSILLTPQPSNEVPNGETENLLEIVEIIWDGRNISQYGWYYLNVSNPTDKVIEVSIFIFVEDSKEEKQWVKCRCGSGDDITFYPDSTIRLWTQGAYCYDDAIEVIAVSGEQYVLEETVNVEVYPIDPLIITGITFPANDQAEIHVTNHGLSTVTISQVTVDDWVRVILATTGFSGYDLPKGENGTITISLSWNTGHKYTFAILDTTGNKYIYTKTVSP